MRAGQQGHRRWKGRALALLLAGAMLLGPTSSVQGLEGETPSPTASPSPAPSATVTPVATRTLLPTSSPTPPPIKSPFLTATLTATLAPAQAPSPSPTSTRSPSPIPPLGPIRVKAAPFTQPPSERFVRDQVLVKLKPEVVSEEVNALYRQLGASRLRTSPVGFEVLHLPAGSSVEAAVERLRQDPRVEYASPNTLAYAFFTPNDPYYPLQWHFDNAKYGGINLAKAWDLDTKAPLYGGNPGIVVAVIDSGVAFEDRTNPNWHRDTYNAYGGSGYSWWLGINNPSWPKSPGYGNNWNEYLSHDFDLTKAIPKVTLSFQTKYDMERNFDFGYVEASDNAGASWTTLFTYTNDPGPGPGKAVPWTTQSKDVSTYAGKSIKLRFRFQSDEAYSDEDGLFNSNGAWYVDEVRITDANGTIFYDNVEAGPGTWEVTSFKRAPDLAQTNFWTNSVETPGNGIDDDGNGYVDDLRGWDFVGSDPNPNDDNGHGTHVSGTIAQSTGNSIGVAGIAFNTTIMPLKVLNSAGSGSTEALANAVRYAADKGAKVINLSLGYPPGTKAGDITPLGDAITYAYNKGVTIMAASGNDGVNQVSYPAAYDCCVIAVGATRYDEAVSYYSNTGSSLDITAPGGDTGVDQNGDTYADGVLQQTFDGHPQNFGYWFWQGTSMATPHVSGVAALILAQNPNYTPDQVRDILQSTAEDKGTAGWDSQYGWGILNAQAAVARAAAAVSISLTTDGTIAFGSRGLGESVDTTPSGINDRQTIRVDAGPAHLNIKTTRFSDGSTSWALGSSNGANQVRWSFSKDGAAWSDFLASGVLYSLAKNLSANTTQDVYFRLVMPASTSSNNQYGATVTIVAVAP